MPTPTWTAKISWSDVAYSDPSPGNPDILARAYWISFTVIAWPVLDPLPKYNPLSTPDFGHFHFGVGVNGLGGGFFGMTLQLSLPDVDPEFSWGNFFGVPTNHFSASDFLSGGTMTVTKDFDADLLTATCDFGSLASSTLVLTLSDLDPFVGFGNPSYNNNYPLLPQGYGAFFTTAAPTFSYPEYEVDYSTKFYDIIAQENGVTYKTIALSAADPGTWFGDTAFEADNISPFLAQEIAPWWTLTQETSRQKIRSRVMAVPFTSWRQLSWFRRLMTPIEGTRIDLMHAPEHAAHWAAYVLPSTPETVNWQRSHDKGHTWRTGTINVGADAADSPSINWAFGKLVATWYDGAQIVQSFSSDLGESWSSPMPLAITGTNPRHLIDPSTNFGWYFYVSSDKLYVVRSGNFGAQFVDGSPNLVLDPITAQTIAAQLALDGSLLVSYLDAGTIKQLRSTDLGRTWSSA